MSVRWAAAAVACLVVAPHVGSAQTATVEGRVTLAPAGRAANSADVRIEGTPLSTMTDSAGRYRIGPVPPGPQVLVVRKIGYAPARLPLTVPATGVLIQDVTLAASALTLPDIIVTADPASRAAGEVATASVIDREAIAAQTAVSIRGALELIPGTLLQPPGLENSETFALRSVPTSSSASITVGGPGAADLAAFGTSFVLDGVPVSNNANLQTVGPRGEVRVPGTSGSGVDLRRIPAATIERVEAIRGIPSARYGDLTQGVIVVETRAGAVTPTLGGRFDPRTAGLNAVGGLPLGSAHTVTLVADATRTQGSAAAPDDISSRLSGQLSHRWEMGATTLNTRVDAWRVLQDNPERPEVLPGRANRNDDRGIRASHRGSHAFSDRTTLEWTAALDHVRRDSHTQLLLTRPTTPFTDRLEEGRAFGRYIAGTYLAALDLDGSEWQAYSRVELDKRLRAGRLNHEWRAGFELRREWNTGAGYQFDIANPPQATFNGVQGFDRPRPFDAVPAVATSAAYLDGIARIMLGGIGFTGQAGLRAEMLHRGTSWLSRVRDVVAQPRFNAEIAPLSWLRFRGGWGKTAKLPPLSMLSPPLQYYDVVNVNWFTTDPAARLAVLSTFIRDPTNDALAFSVGTKAEAGFELATARRNAALSVVFFRDKTDGGVGYAPEPGFLVRDLYDFSDSSFTGQPPTLIEPATRADTVPILVDRPANNLHLTNEGVEVSLTLPELRPLHLRLDVQAAWMKTELAKDGLDFGRTFGPFQVDGLVPRAPYWENAVRTGDRAVLTYRLIHHQPALGLVITATVQHIAREREENVAGTDTLAWSGYITRAGELVPVPAERRGDAEYADVRKSRLDILVEPNIIPADWFLSLQVSKTLPLGGRLGFFAFNALDRMGRFSESGFGGRQFQALRYGLEVFMPLRIGL